MRGEIQEGIHSDEYENWEPESLSLHSIQRKDRLRTYVPLVESVVVLGAGEDPLMAAPGVGSRGVSWLTVKKSTIWGSPENWDNKFSELPSMVVNDEAWASIFFFTFCGMSSGMLSSFITFSGVSSEILSEAEIDEAWSLIFFFLTFGGISDRGRTGECWVLALPQIKNPVWKHPRNNLG